MAIVRLREMQSVKLAKLTVAFLVAVVLGLTARAIYPCTWWLYSSVMALGDGLIVAGIVGLLLELFATKFLIEETAEKVAEKVVGRGLPSNIRGRIWIIANTKLVRKNYVKRYKLTDLGGGKITLETTTEFQVENYGDKTEKYAPKADEEAVFNPKFKYLQYSLKDALYSFTESDLQKRIEPKHGNRATLQTGGDEILIPSRSEDTTAACKVRWVMEVTMPDEYVDLTEFRYPTESAEIYLDQIPDRLEFYCTGKTKDSKTWTFDEPFMEGQQLKVWWMKKSPLQSSDTGAMV
jgi:hypothetical protein